MAFPSGKESAACPAIARAMHAIVRIYGIAGGQGTTPLRIVRLDEPDPGLPKAGQGSGKEA